MKDVCISIFISVHHSCYSIKPFIMLQFLKKFSVTGKVFTHQSQFVLGFNVDSNS